MASIPARSSVAERSPLPRSGAFMNDTRLRLPTVCPDPLSTTRLVRSATPCRLVNRSLKCVTADEIRLRGGVFSRPLVLPCDRSASPGLRDFGGTFGPRHPQGPSTRTVPPSRGRQTWASPPRGEEAPRAIRPAGVDHPGAKQEDFESSCGTRWPTTEAATGVGSYSASVAARVSQPARRRASAGEMSNSKPYGDSRSELKALRVTRPPSWAP